MKLEKHCLGKEKALSLTSVSRLYPSIFKYDNDEWMENLISNFSNKFISFESKIISSNLLMNYIPRFNFFA